MEFETKVCNSCNEEKTLDKFYKRGNGKVRTPCKGCIAKRNAEHYDANADAKKEQMAAWRARNKTYWWV